jgi:hypothetical protein
MRERRFYRSSTLLHVSDAKPSVFETEPASRAMRNPRQCWTKSDCGTPIGDELEDVVKVLQEGPLLS